MRGERSELEWREEQGQERMEKEKKYIETKNDQISYEKNRKREWVCWMKGMEESRGQGEMHISNEIDWHEEEGSHCYLWTLIAAEFAWGNRKGNM